MLDTHVIGIDCAAQHPNFGLAIGHCTSSTVEITKVTTGQPDVPKILRQWMSDKRPLILAFDAPLGWPVVLGKTLKDHFAGNRLLESSDQLFHRSTDNFVREHVKKKPLEVGADKIARAAVRALWVIDDLREHTGNPLPLLWEPGVPHESGIIEVYPAATLKAHGLSDRGYKGSKVKHRDARKVLIACLSKILKFDLDTELLAASDDALDAAICVLAAADFANCSVHLPPDEMVAKKEGWIWFHKTLPIQ